MTESHRISFLFPRTLNLLPAVILAVAVTFLGGTGAPGATRVTTSSGGNWNNTTTWSGGVVPTSSDAAVIRAGASVTVTANATVNSITFTNNSASTAVLTVDSGVTLAVTAGITNRNSATTNTSVLIQGDGAISCATLSVGGTTTPTPSGSAFTATMTSTISNVSVSGNLLVRALYNSTQAAANQGLFALGSGAVGVGGSVVFVTVPLFGPTLTLAAGSQNGTLTLSGATPFSFSGGGSSTFTPNGTGATVIYSGGAQTVQPATYQNLMLSGSGVKTSIGVTVNGILSMRGTATASAALAYGAAATLEYNGSAAQTSGPELTASIPNLTINNLNGVTLAASSTVGNSLTLVSGKLATGPNQVNLAVNASISGATAANYVNGNLQKVFNTGVQAFTFPIGDGSAYAPLVLSNVSVTASGSLMASTASGDHPQFGSSRLDPNRNVNRYWTLTQSGGAFGAYDATFLYPASEVDTNAVPSQFEVSRWNGNAWYSVAVQESPSATSTSVSGLGEFGGFAIGNPSPWLHDWPWRLAIIIDRTKVAGALTNFPVLINLTSSGLQQYAQTGGDDLLFTSSDGTTKLAHEIESYTSSSGTLIAWVNVPVLSTTADTLLYLYYGNATATNQQDAAGTWNPGFKGVWHLNNSFTDATSNNNNGVNTGTTSTTGKIADGRRYTRYDGADYITVSGLMGSPANLTLSAWASLTSPDSYGAEVISLGDHVLLRMEDPTYGLTGYAYDGSSWRRTSFGTNYEDTGWHYFVYTFDDVNNVQRLYVDGVQVASASFSGSISYAGLGSNTRIGRHGNGSTSYDFSGSIDEVRVSATARDTAWISTEYNNQNSPATFYSVGSPEPALPTKLAITSVNGGFAPSVAAPFEVAVQAQDAGGIPRNVVSNTAVTLSVNTGTGTLGGTLTCVIPAGTNTATLSVITYSRAESGVVLTATRTSGDNLTAGNSGPFTVNPGDQTITFSSPGDQTYGVEPIALDATASSGLAVTYSIMSGSASVSNSTLAITGAGPVTLQASQPGNADWNAAAPVEHTISVAPKVINGSITAEDKTYNATATATIATRALSGIVGDDVVYLSGGTATFADKNVGNGKTVTATGLGLGGDDAGNYVLNSTTSTNIANITQAALTVSATGVNKVYDGTVNATVTLSDDRLAGDDLTASYAAASFADKNVGNGKAVSVSGITVAGPDAGNYVFNASAQTTANVSPATLVVTANDTNRPYGTPNPDFTAGYSGFVTGEDAGVINGSPTLSTTAATNSPVGSYPIEVAQGTLNSANYVFDLNNGTLTVTAVPLVLWIEYVTGTGGETNLAIISGVGITPDSLWQVLATTNFIEWIEIGAAQAGSDGAITFTDTDAALYPARFYRLAGN